MYSNVTSTWVWIVTFSLILAAWMTMDGNDRLLRYYNCEQLTLDYPNGIAAEWAPAIGPNLVLNEQKTKIGVVWKPKEVSAVNSTLYSKQSMSLDYDRDGIMCEQPNN